MAEGLLEIFPRQLRDARKAQGWTQAELAERVGLATEVYGRLERGLSLPRTETLVSISRALHVSTDELLGLTDGDLREPAEDYRVDDPTELRRIVRLLRQLPPRTARAVSLLLGCIVEEGEGGAD